MNSMKNARVIKKTIIAFAAIVLLLFLDNQFGYTALKHAPFSIRNNTERGIRISNPIYHHGLSANYNGLARNESEYRFCTNSYGLKSKCDAVNNTMEVDIGFLGDSFTEGLGLPFEQTFVGLIADQLPHKKVANLGVVSYAPTIYYMRLKELLDKGYSFRELVVYIDISDIQDEANYAIVNGKVVETLEDTRKQRPLPMMHFAYKRLRDTLRNAFGISRKGQDLHQDSLALRDSIYDENYERGAWTYNNDSNGYGTLGVEGAIDKAVTMMEKVYGLCEANNIEFSIGVFPWPGQILYDVEDSRQVQVWREFCAGRCKHFFNTFPRFFEQIELLGSEAVIEKFYFSDDMHFNERGNQLIATDFIESYQ